MYSFKLKALYRQHYGTGDVHHISLFTIHHTTIFI